VHGTRLRGEKEDVGCVHRGGPAPNGKLPFLGSEKPPSSLEVKEEGVVIPGTYKNIYGEIVKIDPKTLDPHTEIMRF